MRLTAFTDYALLVLIYLARDPGRFITIPEIAAAYRISANHLMKVAQHLAATGTVVTLRGPRGGLRLARPAETIRVGDVVRTTETDRTPRSDGQHELSGLLQQALAAYMAVLDGCSVADLADAPETGDRAPGRPPSQPD